MPHDITRIATCVDCGKEFGAGRGPAKHCPQCWDRAERLWRRKAYLNTKPNGAYTRGPYRKTQDDRL